MADDRPNIYVLLSDHVENFNAHATRVERFMAAQEERCRARLDMTVKHDKAIFGNGKPGLLEEVKELKTKEAIANDNTARWIAVASAAGAVLALVIPFIKRGA